MNNRQVDATAPSGGRVYYGWVIVAAFFVLNIAAQASGTLNFGLFVIPMSEELGMSRQMIGWAQTVRLWAGGLSGLVIGRWLDRYGPRVPVLVAIVVATCGLLVLARAQSAAVLFGVLLALGASGWTTPGGGALIATVPVSKWFVRQRGRATGVVQLGLGLGGALFLPLTQVLISNRGWRAAWVMLAWLSAVTLPLVVLLRRQPSDLGLQPDGAPHPPAGRAADVPGQQAGGAARTQRPPKAGAARGPARADAQRPAAAKPAAEAAGAPPGADPGHPPPTGEPVWNLRSAIRTASMWRLSGAFAVLGFLHGAASVHRVPHWVELGFSPATVSLAFGMDAATATLMALLAGFVVERWDARIVGTVACGFFCASVALMVVGQAWTPLLFASTILFGAGVGLNMVVQGVIWAQYYGWRFVGTIRGVVLPLTVLAGGFGAPLAGALRDAAGTYRSSWLIVLVLCAIAGGLFFSARQPPNPKPEPVRR